MRAPRRRTLVSALALLGLVVAGGLFIALRHDTASRSPATGSPPPSEAGSTQPQVRWSYDVGDDVAAPVAVIGDMVVLASHHGKVIALDADGERRWEGSLSDGSTLSMAFERPVASDGLVIVSGQDTGLHAFDVETGRVAWRYRGLGQHTTGAQAASGRVFVAGSRGVAALNARTGHPLWTRPQDASTPALAGDTVITHQEKRLVGLDARTGEQRWSLPDDGSTVVVKGRVLYRATNSHRSDRELSATDLTTGENLWTAPSKGPGFEAPVLDGKHLYTTDGRRAFCFRADTGRLLWSHKVGSGPAEEAVLVLRDDLVYATHAGGVVAFNAHTGERAWSYESESNPYSLVIGGDVGYISVGNELRALNLNAQ